MSQIANSQKLPKRIVDRSELLSYYDECGNKRKTHREMGVSRDYIYKWTARWESVKAERSILEELYTAGEIKGGAYQKGLVELLEDKPRSGTPPKISESQKEQIVAMATAHPSEFGYPHTHWTHELLRKAVVNQGIVLEISSRHIGRILKKSSYMSS